MFGSVILSSWYLITFILIALALAIASLLWKNKYSFVLNIVSFGIMIWQTIMLYLLGAEMVEIITTLMIFVIVNSFHFRKDKGDK